MSLLPVLVVLMPVIGISLILGTRGRAAWITPERITIIFVIAGLYLAVDILATVMRGAEALTYVLGGWAPPLGLVLRVDGTGAVLLTMTALIMAGVAIFAWPSFQGIGKKADSRPTFGFWVLLLALWSALNLVFVGQDLFNFFVALEMLTFSAVALVALDGKRDALIAALRYLLFALVGSILYLLGVAIIYGRYGVLDLAILREFAQPDALTMWALALMSVGLMAKAALFPFYLWLPPAHAGAPAPASAMLSALVVKAPFILMLRLWFDLLPAPPPAVAGEMVAALGAAGILFCSILALRQARLKMMIAYSTVAQVGYLFLIFALMPGPDPWQTIGWTGGILQLVSHGLAKAAMFLAAGLVIESLGHDRIAEMAGVARRLPVTIVAFALAGLSLMGLPPSGGFVAKLLLLTAAVSSGIWWIVAVILTGGILAAFYVFRVLGVAFTEGAGTFASVALYRQLVVLALALCAVALGFVPLQPFALLAIGRPLAAIGGLP